MLKQRAIDFRQSFQDGLVGGDVLAQTHEGPHYKDAHRDGLWAVQYRGCHDGPVLREGHRQGARKLEPCQVVTICDHLQLLLRRESKGEITRETTCIPFDRLVQGFRRNCIECGKIGIKSWIRAV